MCPCFVVLEGLDGVGKSTVATMLAQRLDALSLQTPPSELRAVRSKIIDALGGGRAETLFYAATVSSASEVARKTLETGRSVVLDRYWCSTCVYAEWRNAMLSLPSVENTLLVPTMTVYLRASLQTRRQRMEKRNNTAADFATIKHNQVLERLYQKALGHSQNGKVIEVLTDERTPEDVVATIQEALRRGF